MQYPGCTITSAFLAGFLLLIPVSSLAFSGGITGNSGNPDSTSTCSNCHSGGVAPTVNLTGPASVEAGSSNSYTLSMSGGQNNIGGLNISASAGSLNSTDSNLGINSGELVHIQSINVGNAIEWTFDFTAPTNIGTVTIYATALSADGDSSTSGDASGLIQLIIEVTPAQALLVPTAQAGGPYFALPGEAVQFDTSGSVDGDGNIVRFLWDFGDGSAFIESPAPVHSFGAEGTYTVTLAATDNDGLTGAVATSVTVSANASAVQGEVLYNQHCIACHADPSQLAQRSVAQIEAAISSVPAMQSISLSAEELQYVADYLATFSVPTDGPGLYGMFCGACHGADGRGGTAIGVTGAPLQMIDDGIANVTEMQGISLSLEQRQLIADFLVAGGSGSIPGDGPGLYDIYCAVCHGAGGHGGKFLAVTGAPAEMINGAINSEAWMNPLNLSSGQIDNIAAFLLAGGSGNPPTDGAGLYGVFCAVCHGADGRGTDSYKVVTGSSLSFVNGALNNISLMNQLQLSSSQRQQITEFLAAGGGGSKPTTGSGLYKVYCETCHGPNGNGGPEESVTGSSANKISMEINQVSDMQQLAPYLNSGEISLIADFLGGGGGN